MKMKLELYEPRHHDELYRMLVSFSEEIFDEGTANVDMFVKYHTHIYLAIIRDEVVGFTSFVINEYFGLRTPTIGNTYLYVKPEYRRSKALHLMSIQAGLVARDLNMPLEHYVASKESRLLTKRLKGRELYTSFEYSVEECERVINGLKNKVRIKE
jgi:hypothetical protein